MTNRPRTPLASLSAAAFLSTFAAILSPAAAQVTITSVIFLDPDADETGDPYTGGHLSLTDSPTDPTSTPVHVNLEDCANDLTLGFEVNLAGSDPTLDLRAWIGGSGIVCTEPLQRAMCREISVPDPTGGFARFTVSARNDVVADATCPAGEETLTLWTFFEMGGMALAGENQRTIEFDLEPPAPVLDFAAFPVESGIRVTSSPNGLNIANEDSWAYLAGCRPAAGGIDGGAGGTDAANGTDSGAAGTDAGAGGTDAGMTATAATLYPAPPDGFFPCTESDPGDSPSDLAMYLVPASAYRLGWYYDGTSGVALENGMPYDVSLQVIDDFLNASAPVFAEDVTPVPTDDFAETYGRAGGREMGGYCGVAGGPGARGAGGGAGRLVAALLALGIAGALGWARARRRARGARDGWTGPAMLLATAAALGGGLLALLGGVAAAAEPADRPAWRVPAAGPGAPAPAAASERPAWLDSPSAADGGGGLVLASGEVETTDTESPQHFLFELKFGPYLPHVDREFDGTSVGPFAAHFGRRDEEGALEYRNSGRVRVPARVRSRLEFDWQALRFPGGTIGPFAAMGFWNAVGVAFELDESGTIPPEERTPTEDKTALVLWPWSVGAVLRLDYAAREWNIPLVPFVKGAFDYTFYWIRSSSSRVAEFPGGGKARGGIPGWEIDFGGMFLLDFLDPGGTARFDESYGVNNSYAFFEWSYAQVDGFGRRMILSDSTWSIGLAVEY